MPKKLFKRYMPDYKTVREHRHLQFLGRLLHDPNLFHLNRRSASGGFAVGLFVAFLPMPFQMAVAAILSVLFRVNLPIAVALTWVTNPFTMAPTFIVTYMVGAWLLDLPPREFNFEITYEWLAQEINTVWQPFLLGSIVVGLAAAITGYFAVRGLWRLSIVRHRQRKEGERKARQDS